MSALWALLWRFVQPCYVNAALFVNMREVVLLRDSQMRAQVRAQVRALWTLLWRSVRPCYVNAALFVNVREVVLFATQDIHPRCHLVAKLSRKSALQGVKNSGLRMRLRMGLRIGPAKPAIA